MTRRLTCLLLPFLLGGCLLPQPDTPPIGGKTAAAKPSLGGAVPLLPQPDTPPVGAQASGAKGGPETTTASGAADAAVVNNGAGVAPSMGAAIAAPTASASTVPSAMPTPALGKLQGKVSGVTLTTLKVTDESGSTTYQSAAVGSDGSFGFSLAPGRYLLVLTTDKDAQLKPSQVFTVSAGETRTYTITIKDSTEATVSEDAPLASPSPTPTP